MAAPEIAPLPPFFVLTRGMQVRVAAVDPTDGSTVPGVIVKNMSLSVEQEDADIAGKAAPLNGALSFGAV